MVRDAVDYRGEICWDKTKPDGTPRKLCDVTKAHSLGWRHKVELEEGIPMLVKWYNG